MAFNKFPHWRFNIKTLIQCDFDGTITVDDISYGMLDEYADKSWRLWADKYHRGEINVGEFNARVFSLVKEDRETLVAYTRRHAQLRPGFPQLLDFCKQKDIEFVIVSNGLDFYIELVLGDLGLKIKTYAGQTEFGRDGIIVRYIGPDGKEMKAGFKEAYTRLYISRGYRIIYVGNGISDIPAAKLSYRVFAREDLLERGTAAKLKCIPFDDMNDVIKGLSDINQ